MKRERASEELGKDVEEEFKELRDEEKKFLKNWNPEIAMVTIVSIILILGLTVFLGFGMANMQNKINELNLKVSKPTPGINAVTLNLSSQDTRLCAFKKDLIISLDAVSSCSEIDATDCAPSAENVVKMVLFHSPTCPYCVSQVPVMEQLKQKYGAKLEVEYACKGIHEGDEALCRENKDGLFTIDYDTSLELQSQFDIMSQGTPIAVINCKYTRVGSLALRDEQAKTTNELDELSKVIEGLTSP